MNKTFLLMAAITSGLLLLVSPIASFAEPAERQKQDEQRDRLKESQQKMQEQREKQKEQREKLKEQREKLKEQREKLKEQREKQERLTSEQAKDKVPEKYDTAKDTPDKPKSEIYKEMEALFAKYGILLPDDAPDEFADEFRSILNEHGHLWSKLGDNRSSDEMADVYDKMIQEMGPPIQKLYQKYGYEYTPMTENELRQFDEKLSAIYEKHDDDKKEKTCKEGLVPIVKTGTDDTSCVKPASYDKLVQRGWGA